jgi:hypothetical protein
MKNRNENTTFIQLTYSDFTISETFFETFFQKDLDNKKAPERGSL